MQVEQALNESEGLRSLVAYWRSFHREMASLQEHVSPHVDAFVERLFASPGVAELIAYDFSGGRRTESDSSITVMAAASEDVPSKRFTTLSTLMSEEHGIVLRLVYDRDAARWHAYVMADDSRHQRHALIQFPDWSVAAVTDRYGRAEIVAASNASTDRSELHRALVRPQLINYVVKWAALRSTGSAAIELSPEWSVSLELVDDRLVVRTEVAEKSDVKPRYVSLEPIAAVPPDSDVLPDRQASTVRPFVAALEDNVATLEPGALSEKVSLRFFE